MQEIIASVATGTAEAVKVSGLNILDGNFITAIFSGMAAVIGSLGTIIGVVLWGRRQDRKRPLDSDDVYVRACECSQYRAAMSKRIDELGPALERIFRKLTEVDKKSEERAYQMHRRMDPLIERTAANAAEIGTMKTMLKESK